jgi:DNA-binding CsgD family transcriptional regulator
MDLDRKGIKKRKATVLDQTSELVKKLATCRNFTEISQLLTTFPLTDARFSGAILASLDADGGIRELGRFGLLGTGPSKESVALSSKGLIAKAMSALYPSLIKNIGTHAKDRLLTPESDMDALAIQNDLETAFVIPLVDQSYLYGVLGLLTREPIDQEPKFLIEQDTFQALLGMAIRSVAYRNPKDTKKELDRQSPEVSLAHLTFREQTILAALAQDKPNQEISQDLSLSISTIKVGVSEILKKLGVATRKEAGIKARYSGLA